MLARDQLERFRAGVADDGARRRAGRCRRDRARRRGWRSWERRSRTAPRGYPRDHPRAELLRHKALIAGRRVPGATGIARDAALGHVATTWRAAAPLVAWLDAHVGPSTVPPEDRWRGRR